MDEKNILKNDMDKYYKEKDEGYMLRSKCKWVEEGERCTEYFFNMEKNRQKSNTIKEIKDENGILHVDDGPILTATGGYYTNLFKSRNISQEDIKNYLDSVKLDNKLNQEEKKMCDEDITEKELENVIKNLKKGKSPGCDGITPEFYIKFWDTIKDLYMNMIKETQEKGELPYTLRKAILALLFKKGDKTLLKNYRPISLTNYDYKILCFCLANRLQKILKNIIHDNQTGYIKGRYIGANARLIQDYFENCENFQIPGILLFLDFEKAFDSLEWNFMLATLSKFNFGDKFINWVKILYNKPLISIKNNGWLSCDISLERGVRQGCPLSALLFVIAVEIMAINIRNDNKITGLTNLDNEIKQLMYADDTTLLVSDFKSMKNAIENVNKFSQVAGMKLNVEKTEGVLLGPLKDTTDTYEGIKFTNKAIRCLGIYLGHDKNECDTKNWEEKLEKIKLIFERWKYRKLTLFGKILIVKSLAASKIYHVMSILETPDSFLKEFEKSIFHFLWETTDRIKRKTLIGHKYQGGLKMLDIWSQDKALKAGWARRINNKNYNRDFLDMYLSKYGLTCDELIHCNCSKKTLIETLKMPNFWTEVFSSIFECKDQKNNDLISSSELLSEPIWLNKRFRFNGKPLYISNWIKSGIFYVKDLFDINGTLLTEQRIIEKLIVKANWFGEYYKIKKIFKKLTAKYDTSLAEFVNIKKSWTLLHSNSVYCLKTQKSKFYYNIMIDKKAEPNYMLKKWERDFTLDNTHWKNIYNDKIWQIKDKKLAEFNYKFLNNILCTRSLISKWNPKVNSLCPLCSMEHTVQHLLYDCIYINNIWTLIGNILKVNIRYKHLIVGTIANTE